MEHPVYGKKRNLVIYCLFWTLIIGSHILFIHFFYGIKLKHCILDSIIYNSLFGILGTGIWYTVRYTKFDKQHRLNSTINHLFTALLTILIWYYAGLTIIRLFDITNTDYTTFLEESIPGRFINGLLFYILIVVGYYLYITNLDLQKKLMDEERLKSLVKEAELNLLKSQIKPHFLFNSLNSIASLTLSTPDKAREMIIKLSDFLRSSIGQDETKLVPLRKELENISRYLDIEKIRFSDKMDIQFNIEEECYDKMIPNMILQPLFENAIKHGVYESTEMITIELKCYIKKPLMYIILKNNYDVTSIPRKGKGIGLQNIRNRLALIYGDQSLMRTSKKDGNFEVTVTVAY